jgi:hypothetical protein
MSRTDETPETPRPEIPPENLFRYAGRRLVQFDVDASVFARLQPGHYQVTSNPLPEGARCVGCEYVSRYHRWNLVYEHDSFEEVAEGEQPPCIDMPVIEKRYALPVLASGEAAEADLLERLAKRSDARRKAIDDLAK